MLVHEALALIAGRKLKFGSAKDIEASRLFWLYQEADQTIRRRYKEGPARQKKLADLLQGDAGALERFLHPHKGRKQPGGAGEALLGAS